MWNLLRIIKNSCSIFLSKNVDREAGGWRLEAGGWRLEAGGWRLESASINSVLSSFISKFNI
jgi:hypothetical protein